MDEVQRLDDHPFAAPPGQFLPPVDPRLLAGRVGHVHDLVRGRQQEFGVGTADLGQNLHVPEVILVRVDVPLGGEQVERGQLEVGERLDRPAVLPVGGHEPVDVLLPETESCLDLRRASSVSSPARRSTGLLKRATAWGSDADPAAPTAAYWVRRSSWALADQGINSQSRHTHAVSSLDQRSAAVEGRTHPVEELRAPGPGR